MRGSVSKFKRKGKRDGWRARIDIEESTYSNRKQISKVFDTKSEAEQWLAKKNHEIYSGTYIQPSEMPLKDWLNEWMEQFAKVGIRENTYNTYRTYLDNHTIPKLGHIPLKDVTTSRIQQFYNDLNLASATVKHIHAVLRKALEKAVTLGHIKSNPADGKKVEIPKPDKEHQELRYWTQDQVSKFLSAVEEHTNPIFATLFYLAIHTGMRRGELLGLRWQDVNFAKSELNIQQSITRDPTGKMHTNAPKTKHSKRSIALDAWVISKLREHQDYMEYLQEQLGNAFERSDLVFTSTNGKIIHVSNLRRSFNAVIKHADIPKIRFHDLRHTHASIYLSHGTNPKVIQERLGHSSFQITMDIYSHLMPNLQRDEVDRVAAKIHGQSNMEIVKSTG